jgi:hypothetical protein
LDLGAQTNIISPQICKEVSKFQKVEIVPGKQKLKGYDQSEGQNLGTVTLSTNLGENTFDVHFHVSPCGDEEAI